MDTDLKFHGHIRTVVRKAAGMAQNFLKSTVCRKPEFMLFLLTTHIRPVIEYCSCLWSTGYQGDLRLLESVQRRWTKQICGLGSLSYAERLQALNLFSVKGRLLRADMIQCWKMFNGMSHIATKDVFELPRHTGTRGHCYKMFKTSTNTDVRNHFFSVRCISAWNALPEHVVTSRNLSRFKRLLGETLGDALYDYVD